MNTGVFLSWQSLRRARSPPNTLLEGQLCLWAPHLMGPSAAALSMITLLSVSIYKQHFHCKVCHCCCGNGVTEKLFPVQKLPSRLISPSGNSPQHKSLEKNRSQLKTVAVWRRQRSVVLCCVSARSNKRPCQASGLFSEKRFS